MLIGEVQVREIADPVKRKGVGVADQGEQVRVLARTLIDLAKIVVRVLLSHSMVQRCGSALLVGGQVKWLPVEQQFRRMIGYRDLAKLATAVEREPAATSTSPTTECAPMRVIA